LNDLFPATPGSPLDRQSFPVLPLAMINPVWITADVNSAVKGLC
jgi:hypothetical protein